jgi:hypothetical protein
MIIDLSSVGLGIAIGMVITLILYRLYYGTNP